MIDVSVPISAHPDSVPDLPHLSALRSGLGTVYSTWAKVNAAAREVKDRGKLALELRNLLPRVTSKLDGALEQVARQREALQKEAHSPLLGEEPAAAEIRSHFRAEAANAPVLERISKLIDRGDLRTARAVLGAPPYLSGLTEENHRTLLVQARAKFAPEAQSRLADLERHAPTLERAQAAFLSQQAARIKQWETKDAKVLAALSAGGD